MRRRWLLTAAVLALGAALVPPAVAQDAPEEAASPVRQAFLFIEPGMSFQDMLAVPAYRQLARAGGAAMASVRTAPGDEGTGAYLTLGAGARAAGPDRDVALDSSGLGGSLRSPCEVSGTDARLDVEAYANDDAVPGLLASTLHAAGIGTQAVVGEDMSSRAYLAAMDRAGNGAVFGGDVLPCQVGEFLVAEADPALMREVVLGSTAEQVQVIVVSPIATPAMTAASDALPGIVMAEGAPDELFPTDGPMGTLTSTTTRRAGLVSNEDVAPSVLAFFDVAIPAEMKGAPIQILDGPPPFSLHERHVLSRQRKGPMAIGTGIVLLLGALAVWLLARRARDHDRRAALTGAWLVLALMTLPVALLAGGLLAALPWPVLGGGVLLIALGVPALAMRFFSRGRFVPPAIVGGVILVYYLVDALANSPSQLTTFLGSQGFDGGRYFGMHNISLGLILGASLFIAGAVRLRWGICVLVGATILIGFPMLGADNGGSVTLAFAAGLWLALRGTWRRLGWVDGLVIALVTIAGTGVVLVADVVSPQPTHGARFVDTAGGGGIGAVLEVFVDRLMIGVRLIAENPGVVVYLALLPVLLYLVFRPRPKLAAVLEGIPSWRAAIATMLVASIVGFIVNDTGVTASALGVASALAALVYASLTAPEKIAPDERPAPTTD